jgi:hypothetical protein
MAHAYNPKYLGDRDRRITSLRPAWKKLVRCYLKNKIQKWERELGGMSQGRALALHGTCEAVDSNPSTTHKKTEKSLQMSQGQSFLLFFLNLNLFDSQ